LFVPLDEIGCRRNGDVPFLFFRLIVHTGSVSSTRPDVHFCRKHTGAIHKERFSGAAVADDGEISELFGFVLCHENSFRFLPNPQKIAETGFAECGLFSLSGE
jgi:hypothetical protein